MAPNGNHPISSPICPMGVADTLGPIWIGFGGKEMVFCDLNCFNPLHNGENDSYKRQSQLWDQIICQTKTG